jgi:hypothetical protein
MTAAVATADRPAKAGRAQASERNRERLEATARGRGSGATTLEDIVLRAWEGLSARGLAECVVCGGRMRPLNGCGDCGAQLS